MCAGLRSIDRCCEKKRWLVSRSGAHSLLLDGVEGAVDRENTPDCTAQRRDHALLRWRLVAMVSRKLYDTLRSSYSDRRRESVSSLCTISSSDLQYDGQLFLQLRLPINLAVHICGPASRGRRCHGFAPYFRTIPEQRLH